MAGYSNIILGPRASSCHLNPSTLASFPASSGSSFPLFPTRARGLRKMNGQALRWTLPHRWCEGCGWGLRRKRPGGPECSRPGRGRRSWWTGSLFPRGFWLRAGGVPGPVIWWSGLFLPLCLPAWTCT